MKILVVEDDRAVAEALKIILSEQKYAVEIADDGQAGLDFIEAFDYDLLLLDAVLPKLDGVSICRQVRSRGYMMPILLLTGKDSKQDRAIGLDAGADDYVVKPFDPEELCARIRALLRRGNDRTRPILTWENLTLDPRTYEVTYQHQLLNLTPKEYSLLELFLRYSRHLFSCGAILEHLWVYADVPSEEAVRTHIKGLRHKLKAAGAPTDFIETVYGMGYRLRQGEPVVYRQVRIEDRQIGLDTVDAPVATPLAAGFSSGDPHRSVASESGIPSFLTEIWNRHYAQTLDRVATIERAIVALQDLSLTDEIRHQAWHSAHTLAGTLGTFGLPLGSQVARQIESGLDLNAALTTAEIPQLQSDVDKLRQEIASKTPVEQDGLGNGEPKVHLVNWGASFWEVVGLATQPASPATFSGEASPEVAPQNVVPTGRETRPDKWSTFSRETGDRTWERQGDRSPWVLVITAETDLALSLISANSGSLEIVSATELVSSQLDRTPDAIVLDLDCFPQITAGLAALAELERDYPNIPVVTISQPHHSVSERALSANGTQRLRQRIEVARRGARLFLSKPMPAGQILLAVDRVIQQAQTVGRSVQKHQVRVTIVDDDRSILEGVGALLSLHGMTVTTLSEPSRFWETLEASTPDLLILDLDMPTHDGIDLCRAVRTDPLWGTLPILFLTAHAEAIASERVFAAGADDFVTKPVVDATLVTRIINRLDRIGFGRSIVGGLAT